MNEKLPKGDREEIQKMVDSRQTDSLDRNEFVPRKKYVMRAAAWDYTEVGL